MYRHKTFSASANKATEISYTQVQDAIRQDRDKKR